MQLTELQLNFCRDRASVLTAVIPKHLAGFTPANIGIPKIELYEDSEGVVCDVLIGDVRCESFYPSDFMP
jgi:hypothetical protein